MLDSGFTAAYVPLILIYIDKLHHYTSDKDLKFAYLDTGLALAEKALSLYEQIPKDRNYHQSLLFTSVYYYYNGDLEKSKKIIEKANEILVPKDEVYYENGTWRQFRFDNYYRCIENFFNYAEIIPKNTIIGPQLYIIFYNSLIFTGFPEVAEYYMQKFLATTEDTLFYYYSLSTGHFYTGNYKDCIKYCNIALEKDSLLGFNFPIMYSYISLNDYANAFKYARILEQHEEEIVSGISHYSEIIGFLYQKTDDQKKASEYYSRAVELYLSQIDSRTPEAAKYIYHFYLAWTYSAMGEKEKALKYLKELNNRSTIPSSMITSMNDWPLFDNIRNEPEFQKLKKEFEKKYQTEHNRVARLLREKGEIPSATASKQ